LTPEANKLSNLTCILWQQLTVATRNYITKNPEDITILNELPPTNYICHMDDFLEQEVATAIKSLKRKNTGRR